MNRTRFVRSLAGNKPVENKTAGSTAVENYMHSDQIAVRLGTDRKAAGVEDAARTAVVHKGIVAVEWNCMVARTKPIEGCRRFPTLSRWLSLRTR